MREHVARDHHAHHGRRLRRRLRRRDHRGQIGSHRAQGVRAIARLKAAVAQDKAERPVVDHDERLFEKTPEGGKREYVSLARRAVPLIELLDYSLKEEVPVTWGV